MNKATRKAVIAGNWKMNMTPSQATALINEMKPLVAGADCEVVLCVPFVDIPAAVEAAKGSNIKIGAENTPGLGAKMVEEGNPLLTSIKGKKAAKTNLAVKKDGGDIDALTAATISSRAYAEAVSRAYAVFKVAAGWSDKVEAYTGATRTDDDADDDAEEWSQRGNFEPKSNRGKEE